tara:strand:+ start:23 stop:235 length:213 start_codon:yes stop_codon:yes gene_type:complete
MLTPTQIDQSYHKVITTIESCKNKKQLEGAHYMVNNFKKLYKNVGYPKVLSYNLDRKLEQQFLKYIIYTI